MNKNYNYSGLSNEGTTSYVNALLYTLYMTPDFRKILFQWSFDNYCRKIYTSKTGKSNYDDESFAQYKKRVESTCILRQLQIIFVNLQLRTSEVVSTMDLFKCFGWGESEMLMQQDIVEFFYDFV